MSDILHLQCRRKRSWSVVEAVSSVSPPPSLSTFVTHHHRSNQFEPPGSRICKVAAGKGWEVTSFSRSGEPVWSSVTSSSIPPSWSKSVSWLKADMLRPSTYKTLLKDADAVVHSTGILLEADYKGVLSGKESPWSGLSRAFSAKKLGSQNPLERKAGEPLEAQEKDGQFTYELMNRDTGNKLILFSREGAPKRLLLTATRHSNYPRARILIAKRPRVCLHLSCGWSPHAA